MNTDTMSKGCLFRKFLKEGGQLIKISEVQFDRIWSMLFSPLSDSKFIFILFWNH